jgi:GDP-L-fucose synthase
VNESILRGKRIVVTGGRGFLGSHLLRRLVEERGCKSVFIADLPEYNLVERSDVIRMYEDLKPHVVIHLAARVGGIGFNQENPATLFYENAMMGIQLIHEGYLAGVEKFVALGTICAYPNSHRYHSRKKTSGAAIRKKPTHPMDWPRR